jgi:hypothetical protein
VQKYFFKNLWNLSDLRISIERDIQMKEQLFHFIWQNKLYNTKGLTTACGSQLQIVDVGKHNKDGGPDFLQAKIKIDDVILLGNIELHINASDWKLHKHTGDQKYQNVILHVVYFNDDTLEIHMPTLELNGRISPILLDKYERLQIAQQDVICKNMLHEVDEFTIESWKERLIIERMERKSDLILNDLKLNGNDWEKTFYHITGKYFGSHINFYPFELLVNNIDYKILLKHQHDIFQLEALLFGAAGFLNKDFVEIYPRALKEEFRFLKHKYNLKEMQEYHWQFLRIRPNSFPTIRLALFAQLIQKMPLFSKVLEQENCYDLLNDIEVSAYWKSHYTLDKLSKYRNKSLAEDFKQMLYTNVFAPVLFAYAKHTNNFELAENAINLLHRNDAEHNTKTAHFLNTNIALKTGYDSQAMIELYDNYCTKKRCLDCRIGNKILRKVEK